MEKKSNCCKACFAVKNYSEGRKIPQHKIVKKKKKKKDNTAYPKNNNNKNPVPVTTLASSQLDPRSKNWALRGTHTHLPQHPVPKDGEEGTQPSGRPQTRRAHERRACALRLTPGHGASVPLRTRPSVPDCPASPSHQVDSHSRYRPPPRSLRLEENDLKHV